MDVLRQLLVIFAGILACSGLIIAKKPEFKKTFDQMLPVQGIVGVVLLVLGVVDIFQVFFGRSVLGIGDLLRFAPLYGIALIAFVFVELLLGAILGFSLVAKLIPGESPAEKKGAEIVKKLVPVQVPIGIIGIVAALILLLKLGFPSATSLM